MREEDFYSKQQDYWERANDNPAGWLGLRLTTLDVFILLPLIPLIALPIVLWFPWEDWFWRERMPKKSAALSCCIAHSRYGTFMRAGG